MPVSKAPGSQVLGGTVNGAGALTVRATRVGSETTLASIARLVSESQASKAPVQVRCGGGGREGCVAWVCQECTELVSVACHQALISSAS